MTVSSLDDAARPMASRLHLGAAIVVSVFALVVFMIGMGETTPFWDAGEFIATSWILGIPHPPGTPLYVLLGRVATLFPFGTVAERVNGLSAVAGAVAVFFTMLATARLLRLMWRGERGSELATFIGTVAAGLFTAFANTCWVNSIEAEVYSLSNMVMAIGLWATLVWRDAAERNEPAGDGKSLLLVFYLLSLSIGIHLGTYLVLPGLVVLVALERRHAIVTTRDLLLWTIGVPVVINLIFSRVTGGVTAALALAVLVLAGALLVTRRRGFIVALLFLFVLGVSVHLFLLIRSQHDPSINEAAPKTWTALWDVLTRKQYPPTNIFERRAPFSFQIDRMYLFYLRQQFALGPALGLLGIVVPLALGILGAIAHLLRRPRDGAMMLSHFLVMSLLLVLYLNLSGTFNEATGRWEIGEVRERDYFFAPSFQIFAMWIGIGIAALLLEMARGDRSRKILPVAAAVGLLLGLLPLRAGFAAHDRRGNFVARDYGYNILNFLAPDAILFTNGDNDTFPLWYLQEVEGIRKDVRVVCLSLLNTGWYIKQLRDLPPKLPITMRDGDIDSLRVAVHPEVGYVVLHADGSYEPGTVKDVAVRHIIAENRYERPIYFAVTVPDRVGFDRQLSFEGMVFRVNATSPPRPLDFDKAYANAFQNYLYRGVLLPDDTRDPRVQIDETGEYLIHNYVVHFAELGYELETRGRYEEALRLFTRCEAVAPGRPDIQVMRGALYADIGQAAAAESLFDLALRTDPENLDALYRLGVARYRQGQLAAAAAPLEKAIAVAGGQYFEPTLWLARVEWSRGRPAAARERIAAWVETHPNDARATGLLAALSAGDDSGLPR
jgi:tetratricopeptide (TPR) repeat protein